MQNDWSDTLKTKLVLVCFAGEEKVLFGVILRGRGHIQASLEGTDRGLGTCTVLAGGTLSSFPVPGRRYWSQRAGLDSVWAAFRGLGEKFGLFKVHLELKSISEK